MQSMHLACISLEVAGRAHDTSWQTLCMHLRQQVTVSAPETSLELIDSVDTIAVASYPGGSTCLLDLVEICQFADAGLLLAKIT